MARVLIVEDEGIVAWHIQSVLESLGHTVVASVASGEEAIQTADQERPDLVMMDIRLDGSLDGIAAAEEIYRRFNIPAIYLTAYADDNTLRRAIATAPFGYLVKPIQGRELHVAIAVAMQRHQLECRLKETRQWLSDMLSSLGDGAIATDLDGNVSFMNPVAEALTGWQQQEAFGKPTNQIFNIVHAETQEPLKNPITQAIQEGQSVRLPDSCLLRAKDGAEKPVGDSAAPIRNQAGQIIGGVLVFRDDSIQQQTQAELRERIAALEQIQMGLVAQIHEQSVQLEQAIASIQIAIQEIREM